MKINSKTIPAILLAGALTFSPVSIKIEKEGSRNFVRIEQMSVYANEGIKVNLNGSELSFDQEPKLVNDRTFVPMRAIFEGLGASVSYDDATSTVTSLTEEGVVVKHQIGTNTISMNDATKEFDASSVVENGRTLVPVRLIAESLGAEVNWDDATKTVIIEKDRLNEQGLYFDPYNDEEVKKVVIDYEKRFKAAGMISNRTVESAGVLIKILNRAKNVETESEKWDFMDNYSEFVIKLIPHEGQFNKNKLNNYKLFSNITERATIKYCEDSFENAALIYFEGTQKINAEKKLELLIPLKEELVNFVLNDGTLNTYAGKIKYSALSNKVKCQIANLALNSCMSTLSNESDYEIEDKVREVYLELDAGKAYEDPLLSSENDKILVK